MKKLLFSALMLPLCASAQSIDIRGFGGVMMNTRTNLAAMRYDRFSRPNAVYGIGGSYRVNQLEGGLSLGFRRYSFKISDPAILTADQINPVTGYAASTTPSRTNTIVMKEPAFHVAAVFNYHFGKGKIDWYAGISPAFVRYTFVPPTDGRFRLSDGANSWSVEGQIGAAYEVRPRLRAFAALQGGSVWVPYLRRNDINMWAAMLNLGVQFRVWQKAAVPPPAAEQR